MPAVRGGGRGFLVTGVAGFIGSNLAERLVADGNRVVGVDNLSYGLLEQVPDRVEFHRGDIRDTATYRWYEGSDVVFHLAAKNCIADCQSDPVDTFDINVHGTAHVFEASTGSLWQSARSEEHTSELQSQ